MSWVTAVSGPRSSATLGLASGLTARAGSGVSLSIFSRRAVPRQQIVDAVDLVIGDAFEDLGEPGLRVDVGSRGNA